MEIHIKILKFKSFRITNYGFFSENVFSLIEHSHKLRNMYLGRPSIVLHLKKKKKKKLPVVSESAK